MQTLEDARDYVRSRRQVFDNENAHKRATGHPERAFFTEPHWLSDPRYWIAHYQCCLEQSTERETPLIQSHIRDLARRYEAGCPQGDARRWRT